MGGPNLQVGVAALVAVLLLLGPAACSPAPERLDFDRDGSPDDADCGPSDAAVHPGAADSVGDGFDQDCDGLDGQDRDGDGHASVASGGLDCNDADDAVHPDAFEEPEDGVDNDCQDGDLLCDADGDGEDGAQCAGLDCDDTNTHCILDCSDGDGDGVAVCAGDCDDLDGDVAPLLPELCDGLDSDCDGAVPVDEQDLDGDGSRACDPSPDCDDADPLRFPGNPELCDGLDGDCDPATEAAGGEEDGDGDGSLACDDCFDDDPDFDELDADADGWTSCDGDCNDLSAAFHPEAPDWAGDGADTDCDGVPGVDADEDGSASIESGGQDCDDLDSSVLVGMAEVCDGIDQDCDSEIDEDFDDDGDGATFCSGECDDDDATVFPGAPELCNGLDDDCDAVVPADEQDLDADGFLACAECDDARADANPAAAETCDGTDENCDGLVDDGFDVDADGVTSCAGDCDDDNALVGPAEVEVCDGQDTDCDPSTDVEGGELDVDGDQRVPCAGWMDQGALTPAGVPLLGGDDCDDDNAFVFPGAYEYCDGLDNDCVPATAAIWGEADADEDGYLACAAFIDHGAAGPGGPLLGGLDCDDDNAFRFSGAPEVCDGWDNDCDLAAPDETDGDEDGFLPCSGFVDHGALNPAADPLLGGDDCEEGQPHRFPGNPEVCDGLDNDCDAATDPSIDEADVDGDTWLACDEFVDHGATNFAGLPLAGAEDCDDDEPLSHPGLESAWEDPDDGMDAGCDGFDGNWLTSSVVDYFLLGEPLSYLGAWVASAGDVDGDGLDDFVAGSPDDNEVGNDAGKVYLVFGASLAAADPDEPLLPDVVLLAEPSGGGAGHAVDSAGDVDGDGLGDLLVAAPRNGNGGAVYVVLGADIAAGGTFSLADAHAKLTAEDSGDRLGGNAKGAAAGAGDVDGDGLGDIVIGAPHSDQVGGYGGVAYVVFGSSLAVGGTSSLADADVRLISEAGNSHAGISVDGAGDVDGDGLDDVLVGADFWGSNPNQVGKTYVVLGADMVGGGDLPLASAHAAFVGEAQGDASGFSVAFAGDVDGDGLSDLLIGTKYVDKAYLVLGSVAATGGVHPLADAHALFLAEAADDDPGYAVSSAGDVDGDGLSDILIGAKGNDEGGSNAGKSYLFLGPSLALSGTYVLSEADLGLVGEHLSAASGFSVATAGDLNGDGLDDLLIGDRNNGSGGSGAGKVHVLLAGF